MLPRYYPIVFLLLLMLSACNELSEEESDYDFAANEIIYSPDLAPVFDPANGLIPSMNDVFLASDTDETLNIPVDNLTGGEKVLVTAMNTLDGYGLSAPFSIDLASTIDPASVVLGSSVHVLKLSMKGETTPVPVSSSELFVTTNAEQTALLFIPLMPLAESTRYVVVLTNGLRDTEGRAASPSTAYLLTKGGNPLTGGFARLEPLRVLTNKLEALASSTGIAKADIVLSWAFTTQSVTPVLAEVAAQATAMPAGLMNPAPAWSGQTSKELDSTLAGMARIYAAELTLPYYLQAASAEMPMLVKTGYWHGKDDSLLTRRNPTPMKTVDVTVPLLISIPNNTNVMPAEGWPVVIFQHGINGNRTQILALADRFASAGIAVVAMDLPLHGVTDKASPFKTHNERTFDVDLDADGVTDGSGAHFINLESLLTSRDNIRQAISDLLVLRKSIANLNPTQDERAPYKLNPEKVGFVGNSLGGIVGVGYLSVEDKPTPASIVVAGGGIARLLDASPTFGPAIRQGLAQNGVIAGSTAYNQFMTVTQMIMDAADPILLGKQAAAKHPIHFVEVMNDEVVPNIVDNFPLSGTEPLIGMMGLQNVYDTTPTSKDTDAVVRFVGTRHNALLGLPTDPVTKEIQSEVIEFQLSQQVKVSNVSVIKTAPAP